MELVVSPSDVVMIVLAAFAGAWLIWVWTRLR